MGDPFFDSKALDQALLTWFPPVREGTPVCARSQYKERHIRDIASLLHRFGRLGWNLCPRIYVVLRTVGQLSQIAIFVNDGITDTYFPFDKQTLPRDFQPASARAHFLEAQRLLQCSSTELERTDGGHQHFSGAEASPFKWVGELGHGGSGTVDHVSSNISRREYARKRIRRGRTPRDDRAILLDFEMEVRVLKRLSHHHIVKFIGSYTDARHFGIVMSPVADQNLKEFLELITLDHESRPSVHKFFGCLAAALQYLHERKIRHKDVKPQNILVKAGTVFLTDFGGSFDWSDRDTSQTAGPPNATIRYRAPEVAREGWPRGSSADIWSLGCVFLEMWTILNDHRLSDLVSHLQSSGSASTIYHENLIAVNSWCELLESSHVTDAGLPGAWIASTLCSMPQDRIKSGELFEQICNASLNSETMVYHVASCCRPQPANFENPEPYKHPPGEGPYTRLQRTGRRRKPNSWVSPKAPVSSDPSTSSDTPHKPSPSPSVYRSEPSKAQESSPMAENTRYSGKSVRISQRGSKDGSPIQKQQQKRALVALSASLIPRDSYSSEASSSTTTSDKTQKTRDANIRRYLVWILTRNTFSHCKKGY